MCRTTGAGGINAITRFQRSRFHVQGSWFKRRPRSRSPRSASALVLALLTVSSCHRGPSGSDLRRTFDAANLAFLQGELTEARALAERNLTEVRELVQATLPPDASFDSLRARQTFLEARVLLADRHFNEALSLARRAAEIAPRDQQLRFDTDPLVGQILFQTGHWDEGEAVLTGTVRAASESGDRYHEAFALHQLGMGQFVRGRFDQALSLFERVLAFSDLSAMSIYAKALNNAGMCYSRLGQFERALSVQRRAVDLQSRRPRSTDYEQALGQLGNTYLLQQDFHAGSTYVQRAFEVARDAAITDDAMLWAGNLAQANIESGQWDEAERYNEEAKSLWAMTQRGDTTHYALNSAKIAMGRRRLDIAKDLFEALAIQTAPPAVLWNAQAGLGDVAKTQGDAARATRHYQAALDIVEQTRSELLKTDYKLSFLTQLISFYQVYVETLVRQGSTDRALEVADSSRGRVLAERQGGKAPPRVSARSLRALAQQTGSVFLSYWLASPRSFVWVIAGGGIRCVELPSAPAIETLVRAHQSAIANVLADPLKAHEGAGSQLYRMLVAPAVAGLPANSHIVIVPDGALHAVNFETLPVDGPKRHYWIEDAEIQIAPSLASLTTAKPVSSAARSLLLIGNPAPRAPEYPALDYAGAEMTDVARHFETDNVISFDGVKASTASYRAARPEQFSFIHFTAHATANVESPLDSAVILSGPDQAYKLYARDVAARPLAAELVTV